MAVKTKTLTRRVVDMEALYREIGRRMRAVREQRGLSQQHVGIALGVTRANIANLESGAHRILLEHIYNAAMVFNVPVSKLLP